MFCCCKVSGFFFCLSRCANHISLFFPPLCCCLYYFKCMLAAFTLRSLWPGLLLALPCTSSLTCCLEPNSYFTWTPLSFLILFMLLGSSPQSCQLWWHQPSQPFAGEGWWLVQWKGCLSNGVECHSSSYVPLSVSSSLWTGVGFLFFGLETPCVSWLMEGTLMCYIK